MGGTKIVVKGLEFGASEAPPWKFLSFDVVTSEIGADHGDEPFVRSSVTTRAKQGDGGALIQVNDNKAFSGSVRFGSSIYERMEEELCLDASGIGVEAY